MVRNKHEFEKPYTKLNQLRHSVDEGRRVIRKESLSEL